MKPIVKRIIFASALALTATAAYFGYEYWQQREREKEHWSLVVDQFQRCDLYPTLAKLGLVSVHDSYGVLRHQLETDELAKLLASLPTSLENVWLDPDVESSLGYIKQGQNSINLLDQCKARISKGHVAIWLDVGKYYLATGNSGAVQWLNSAAEAGIADADVLIAHAYRNSLLSSIKDEKQAFLFYLKAAKAGSQKGQLYAGELLATVNPKTARTYVVAAAHGGNLAAAYALQSPLSFLGTSLDEASLKSYYYWNLIFFHLQAKSRKSFMDLAFPSRSTSANLSDDARELAFDGLPIGVITSGNIIERQEVKRYDVAEAELNARWLEKQLSTDARIQVQEYAKKWIDERIAKVDEDSKMVTPQAPNAKTDIPRWKPVVAPICKGRELNNVQSGADLFATFKKYVWTVSARSSSSSAASLGTAVAIGPHTLATNCHVIGTNDDITVTQDGTLHKANLSVGDPKRDVCLLEVKDTVPFAVNSASVSKLQVGSTSYALGNPQGLNLTFSNGIVSGVRKSNGRDFIQTTAPISKGSSGGALIDDRGNLLGITTFYLQGGQAMNFAIPVEEFCKD
jgi:hypothetical protein